MVPVTLDVHVRSWMEGIEQYTESRERGGLTAPNSCLRRDGSDGHRRLLQHGLLVQ